MNYLQLVLALILNKHFRVRNSGWSFYLVTLMKKYKFWNDQDEKHTDFARWMRAQSQVRVSMYIFK
jgi:hypothetical protein